MAEQSLQIKRNKNIFDTKDDAVNHLKSLSEEKKLNDGEIVLCRYFNNGTIQTLIGFETIYEEQPSIAYLDSFSEVGDGFIRDDDGILQLSVGDGLKIDENHKLDVKIDNEVTNFLEVNTNGMSVQKMNANVTKTTEDILVMGGPLATDDVKAILPRTTDGAENPYIAAETNLQELLLKLFCKEMYPTISSSNSKQGNVTAYINAPTITLTNTNTNLEVGTYISATTISFSGNSKARTTASTVSGLTYGYSYTDDNVKDSSGTSITKTPTTNIVSSSTATMSCNLTGFTVSKFNDISGTTIGNIQKNNFNLGQVIEGENKIKISITGQTISYVIDAIDTVYPCSNIGNTSGTIKTTKVEAKSGTTTAPTSSTTKTITGVRYGFYGKVDKTTTTFNSDIIRGLDYTIPSSATTKINLDENDIDQFVVAIPQTWNKKISEVYDPTSQQSITNTYKLQSTPCNVEGSNKYTPISYDIYVYKPTLTVDNIKHQITLGNN